MPRKTQSPLSISHRAGSDGNMLIDGSAYPVAPKREQPIQRRSTCTTHGLPLPCQFCERWWQKENALAERTEWEGA